jgi:anti-anti-sigma regulatory factor
MSRQMSTIRIQEGGRCVLRLTGDLDALASRELARKVAGEASSELMLDFFEVASIDDRGLADLADALREHPHVTLRGLRDHQLRLLAYLGVETARTLVKH